MKQLVTSGQASDLVTQPSSKLVLDFIKDNWDTDYSTDLPTTDGIIWGQWWTGTNGLHIHATEILKTIQDQNLGLPGLVGYRAVVTLDLFSRSINAVYPANLNAAAHFIQQLIELNETTAISGVSRIRIIRGRDIPDQDPRSTVYRYTMDVELIYSKSVID